MFKAEVSLLCETRLGIPKPNRPANQSLLHLQLILG
jgi:hypothetical protein